MKLGFNMEDAGQVFVGGFALAVPISFSEEAWLLGETLPLINLMMLLNLSVVFLGIFTYQSVFQKDIKGRWPCSFSHYCCIFNDSFGGLFGAVLFGQVSIISRPNNVLKRVIVITMPASMGAIVVDSFDKE